MNADRGGTAVGVAYQRQTVASQPVRLLPRPVFLAGRENLLADLHAQLSAEGGTGPRVVTLHGLGGAGKTSVAVEYAHRHLAALGVVWLLAAEEPAALAAGFGELATQLGARDLLSGGDPVAQVHGVLAAWPGEWLLIFDNAPGPAAVQSVLPPAGRGRVLITSQDPHWPGAALEVPVLEQDVAAGFLQNRTGSAETGAARELAAELDGLPLALEQAAAYMVATDRTIIGYLDTFHGRRSDLLARGEPIGYGKQVATTWSLALDQLQQAAPQAAGLLRLLACCAPELVPLRLLLQPRPELVDLLPTELVPLLEDPLAVDDAVAALRRFSLISPPQQGAVSVHRLVQAITSGQLPPGVADGWCRAARALIEAALPDDTRQPGNWPVYAALLPHAEAALPLTSDGMARIASYLGNSGNYTAARDLLKKITSACDQVLGADHPRTLSTRADLAYWTGEAGEPAAARDQCAALLPIRERVSGADHPDTLNTRVNLARWTGWAGDPAAARDQCGALLPIHEHVLGADHPDTLNTRADLAYWTGEAGDYAAARDQCAALLRIRDQVLGADHPDTLNTRVNLARWTGWAGDPAAARDQCAALLPIYEHVLGADHPDTLKTLANIARWTGEAGEPSAARDQCAALLPIRERVSGADHPDTLITRGILARWTGWAGDPAAAREQYAALLPIHEHVLGADHPDTLNIRANLAYWTGDAGDPAAARDQCAALLPNYEHVLGADHPDTLKTRADLIHWAREADHHDDI